MTGFLWGCGIFGVEGMSILVSNVSRLDSIFLLLFYFFVEFLGVWGEVFLGGVIIFLVLFCFLSFGG